MRNHDIAKQIKNITFDEACDDFIKLQNINLQETSLLSRVGLKFINYYTFVERLDTTGGNKGISFFNFVEDWNEIYCHYPFLKRMYNNLCLKHPTNFYKCMNEIFHVYFSSINSFRPIVAMQIYDVYKPKNVLNVCSGWGAFLTAAAAMNIPKITAIDNNPNLLQPYTDMIRTLDKYSASDITFINNNALTFDFSNNSFDMIILCPPYYNKEIYGHMPAPYNTKHEWNESFYKPLFTKLWKYLETDGRLIVNVPMEIYKSCLIPLFGLSNEKFLLPKHERKKPYQEYIYVWKKT